MPQHSQQDHSGLLLFSALTIVVLAFLALSLAITATGTARFAIAMGYSEKVGYAVGTVFDLAKAILPIGLLALFARRAYGSLFLLGTAWIGLVIYSALATHATVGLAITSIEQDSTWKMETRSETKAELERIEADLLIMWRQHTPDEARSTPLFREKLCFVHRKNHPRGKKNPTVEELCQFPHAIIAPDAGSLWGVVDDELQKLGRTRNIVASLPSFMAVPALVASTDLIAAIPRKLAETTSERLDVSDLPFANMDFEKLMSWHPQMHADPATNGCAKKHQPCLPKIEAVPLSCQVSSA